MKPVRIVGLGGRTSVSGFITFIIWCVVGWIALFFYGLIEARKRGFGAGSGELPPPGPLFEWLTWVQLAVNLIFLWIAVRRFHDQDRPGWLALIPTAAGLAMSLGAPIPAELALLVVLPFVIALLLPGTPGPNRYGPDPRGYRSREHYLEHQQQTRRR